MTFRNTEADHDQEALVASDAEATVETFKSLLVDGDDKRLSKPMVQGLLSMLLLHLSSLTLIQIPIDLQNDDHDDAVVDLINDYDLLDVLLSSVPL